MTEYSVEEVREMAKAMSVASCVSFHPDYRKDPERRVWSGDASKMLTTYADLREQIERAREGVTDEDVYTARRAYAGRETIDTTDHLLNAWMRSAIQSVAHLLPSERGGVE